jgi:SSS family solute:Na+ symporter
VIVEIWIGYGGVVVFFAVIVLVLERSKRTATGFSDYATAGRSFGPFYSTMAFINTWLPGTIFIAFAGYAASAGVAGFYFVPYSLLAVVLMFFLAKPVHRWGKRFDLRTQADLLGLRYDSKAVRVIAAVIGIVASFPWLVLGMQSLTYVFSYLSFGTVPATAAVFIGIAVIVVRQIWTVRLGARGIVISDMVQGIVAYGIGTLIAFGLLVWLIGNGHGFDRIDPAFTTIPGPDSAVGGLYFFSLVITGALGAWSWPDIFVRLFTSNGTATIKRSSVQAAPIILIFGTAVSLFAIAASTYPGVAEAPDAVWFIVASVGGPVVLTLAGLCVLAGTMGNVGANLQALGTQAANDIVGVARGTRVENPRIGQISVAILALVAAVFALTTATSSAGLVQLAQISYQGIVQLAPTLFFGIFWRRGTAIGAAAAMISGFVTAGVLQFLFPVSIPALGGMSSGVAALIVNALVYVAFAFLPASAAERARVDRLFDSLSAPDDEQVAGSTDDVTLEGSTR